jgi:WD40 repeat protein
MTMLQQGIDEKTSGPRHGARWALALAAACAVFVGVSRLAGAAGEAKPAGGAKAKARADLHGDPLPPGALARLGTLRMRHGAPISFVAFTPDRKALLTASPDNSIRLWDMKTGKELRRFGKQPVARPGPGGMAFGPGFGNGGGIALSPDGKTLAALIGGNTVQLWDVATGKELRSFQAAFNTANTLVFSPDGKTLAGRGHDPAVRLWEVATGKELRQFRSAQNNPNGGVIIMGGFGGGPSLVFSPDGKFLATPQSFFNNMKVTTVLQLWEAATAKEVKQIPVEQPNGVSVLTYSPDGKMLAYASGNAVHLCTPETGKELRNIPGQQFGITALAFSPDSKTLAVKGLTDPQVRLYEAATGKARRQLGEEAPGNNLGLVLSWGGLAMGNVAFSSDGKLLALGGGHAARMWETETGKEAGLPGGHRGEVTALAVAPGGLVASKGADNTVRLWEAGTGKERHHFRAPAGTTQVAFAPDGKTVALAHTDNSVRLHEMTTGKELRRVKGHQNGVAAVAFSPDGKTLATRGSVDNTIRLYEAATGKELRAIAPKFQKDAAPQPGFVVVGGLPMPGMGLAFSPDGRMIVSPGPNNVNNGIGVPVMPGGAGPRNSLNFWDVATGKELYRIDLPQQYAVLGFAVSPDGRMLATENSDQTVTLWEIASGKERTRLGLAPGVQPPPGGVMVRPGMGFNPFGMMGGSATVAFAPDGRRLIVRAPDGSVPVWDAATGKALGRLQGHEGDVTALAFAPDGKTVVSGSRDTTALVWDVSRLQPGPQPAAAELKPAEVEALWTDLAGGDAAKAFQGIQRLAGAPGQAIPLLRERLRPAPLPDASKVGRWIADLDGRKFAVRDRATRELEKLGDLAVPALQKVLTTQPPLETRQRVERLLEKLTGTALSSDQLRLVRAVEVLERLGTPEARRVLETLAGGAPGALPTREARAVLDRLARQSPARP